MRLKLIIFLISCFGIAPLWSQSTISGTITDEQKVPLPGVNVTIKGTTTGVAADFDGNFTIDVEEGQTLLFTSLGFKAKEVVIASQKSLAITMVEDAASLDEVVVIGYGSSRKSDLTGSISSVSSEDLTKRPVQSVGQALQGQATGVQVRTNSAAPGGGTSIVIRGQNSVNSGASPLYVVDGIPLSNIDNISVEDIESIEVLKDASSAAIYGSRGANGVVLITSKKGKVGAPKISYSTRTTIESIPSDLGLMNGTEFAEFYNAYDIASGADPADVFYNGSSALRPLPSDVGEGTDWVGEISGTGIIENHQLTFSSGSETSRTSVSLNYLDHDGIVKGGSYDRLGVRLANQMDVTPWLSTAVNLFVTREDQTSSGSVISEAIRMSPALSIYNEDGTYAANNLPAAQGLENPIATANEVTNETKNWDIIGNFELTLKPFKNFNFKTSFGGDFNNFKYGFYNPSTTITGGLLEGEATIKNSNTSHFVNSNIFSYNNVFNDKHRVDVIAGMTYEEQTYEDFSVTASDFFTDAFLYNNIDSAGLFGVPESSKEQWQLLSYLGRVNYSFDSKYLVSASARYDGSSRFGEGNKWGFFPAVSGGWIVSSEDFMANSKDVINNLKLRAGWAITGNQDIGLQKSLAVFNVANYPVGTSIESGVSASRLANGDLKWEETASINVGLDLRLFNRVSLAMDYYEKTTTDLLLDVALVETSGFSTALLNTGELQNKGFEISVNTNVINNENFKFNLKTDLFLNKSEIISLVGDATQEWRIGNPLGAARGYVSDGIIQNQEELDAYSDENGIPINGLTIGEERAVDQNGDGVIDLEDQVITFDPNPDFSYAISPSFSYKDLSLDLFFYGVQGNQIRNTTASLYRNVSVVRTNISADVVNNYWTPENTDAKYPRLAGTNDFHTQRLNIEDGSFLRLQNIRFGYTLPKLPFFESASVYFSAQNVFTITKYSGFDPDISSIDSDGDLVIGEDNNSYPIPKSYTLGLQVNF